MQGFVRFSQVNSGSLRFSQVSEFGLGLFGLSATCWDHLQQMDLPTDFPKSLENNFRQTYYKSGMLPNRVTDEWKQIAAYCIVTYKNEKQKRMENIYRYVFSDYDDSKPFSYQKHYHALSVRLRRARDLEKQRLEKQQSKTDAQQVDKSHDGEKELKKSKRAKTTVSTPEAAAVADQEAEISERAMPATISTPDLEVAAVADQEAAILVSELPISSEVDAEATKQNDSQQDQNHDEENESKKLAKKYFEYFGGQADEREQAIENGLYPPCRAKRESQYRQRPGSLLMKSKDLEEGFLRYPVASADYAAAPIERPQAFEKARAEDFYDEAGHAACGYTLVNLCSTPSADVFEENLCARGGWDRFGQDAGNHNARDGSGLNCGTPVFLDHFDSCMEDKSHLNMSRFAKAPTYWGTSQIICKILSGDPPLAIDETICGRLSRLARLK